MAANVVCAVCERSNNDSFDMVEKSEIGALNATLASRLSDKEYFV